MDGGASTSQLPVMKAKRDKIAEYERPWHLCAGSGIQLFIPSRKHIV